MTTVYGAQDAPVDELYGIAAGLGPSKGIHAISWIRDDGANASLQMTLTTFPLAFDGKKTRKQVVAVNIHASSGVWTGQVYVNDQAAGAPQFTFATYPDPVYSLYAPSGVQGLINDVAAQDLVCLAGKFYGAGNATDGTPLVGYRFAIQVIKGAPDYLPAQLYAIDVGYVDVEKPEEGDA